jgi:serine/threonine protein kinase
LRYFSFFRSSISPEAKELISGLLTVDVNKRLTVHQALQHAWFSKKSEAELQMISLAPNLQLLRDFKKGNIGKFSALATSIAIDVVRKVSGASLTSRMLNDAAIDVVRKLSGGTDLNQIALEVARNRAAAAAAAGQGGITPPGSQKKTGPYGGGTSPHRNISPARSGVNSSRISSNRFS